MKKILLTVMLSISVKAMADEVSCLEGIDSYKTFMVELLNLDAGKTKLEEKLSNQNVVPFVGKWQQLHDQSKILNARIAELESDKIKDAIQVELAQSRLNLHEIEIELDELITNYKAKVEAIGLEVSTSSEEDGLVLTDLETFKLDHGIHFEYKGWIGASSCSRTKRTAEIADFYYSVKTDSFGVRFIDESCEGVTTDLKTIIMQTNPFCALEELRSVYKKIDAGI